MDSKKPIEIFIILVVYDLAYIMNVLLRTIKTNVSMKLRKKKYATKIKVYSVLLEKLFTLQLWNIDSLCQRFSFASPEN